MGQLCPGGSGPGHRTPRHPGRRFGLGLQPSGPVPSRPGGLPHGTGRKDPRCPGLPRLTGAAHLSSSAVRLVIARCTVDYEGRLSAHLPEAVRLIMVKADGCVAIHADGGAYKPLNWMTSPNTLAIEGDPDDDGAEAVWT